MYTFFKIKVKNTMVFSLNNSVVIICKCCILLVWVVND